MTDDFDVPELMAVVRRGRLRVGQRTKAITLILHGGRAEAPQLHRFRDVSYLRMLPFANAVRKVSRGRIAPFIVHNTHGGWVAASGSGIVQAKELIRELHDETSLPLILLGHSSGGWASLRAGGERPVLGSVALAPWVADDEPADHLVHKKIRVVHGDGDTICSPVKSREFVERLQAAGGDAQYLSVPGGDHAMMKRPGLWHRLAADAVVELSRRETGQA